MTNDDGPNGRLSAESVFERTLCLLKAFEIALQERIDLLLAEKSATGAEVGREMVLFVRLALRAGQEAKRLEEQRDLLVGTAATRQLDLDAARDEIGRRLARLCDAAAAQRVFKRPE